MGKIISDIFKGNIFTGDKGIWMIYFFLCLISLVEVYSASSNLTYWQGKHWDPMINQAMFLIMGTIVVLLVHKIPCKYFMLFPLLLYPLAVILLAYILICGGSVNGANRWMSFGGMSFQPSEIGKAALVMIVAVVLAKTQAEVKVVGKNGKTKIVRGAIKGSRTLAFKIIVILSGIICGLIFTENFSTAAILFTVILIMMFVGRVPYDLLLKLLGVIFGLLAILVVMAVTLDDETLDNIPKMHRVTTWKHRLSSKIDERQSADGESTYNIKDHLQTAHASMAIANSNVIGRGPGNSVERDFLSHAESDFIYSIIIEELGIFGAAFVLLLYVALLIRAGRIARKCRRYFPAYLVIGLATMIVLQAMVNMGVATGLFPVTGQPLPLISRGGSSLLMNCVYIGMILSVSRYAEKISTPDIDRSIVATTNESDEYYSQENMD